MFTSIQTKRTVLAYILHGVQDGVQSQMTAVISEGMETSDSLEQHGDDTALYRISGWALKSVIDIYTHEQIPDADTKKELALLQAIKRPNSENITLPLGAKYIDRGGLTFVDSFFLPWLHAIEASMKTFLNQDGYRKYGKDIFTVINFKL